jgi:hypothetical protein
MGPRGKKTGVSESQYVCLIPIKAILLLKKTNTQRIDKS